jgi:hypothetical protein
MRTVQVQTLEVKDPLPLPRATERFRKQMVAKSLFLIPRSEALATIEDRQTKVGLVPASVQGEKEIKFWNDE